ncbi:putative deoxyribonuclease tatdn3 isoform X2 [Sphaeramia orbicularis]|uniref:putative deoxyribonuclease tatdn3 isoform X2 n=1 Tax=Sphaeramia orbicularis TaxID=375764 RepID=UPI00117F8DD0|nr:putative deoxyribonuclease tatdn3 isoform X2 [Sphaeramia orbicularis]
MNRIQISRRWIFVPLTEAPFTLKAGVQTLITVTEEVGEFDRVLQLQKRYPDLVAPGFGVHPLQAGGSSQCRSVNLQDLDAAMPLFYQHRERLVAVGEIGLDFTPWFAPTRQNRDDQMSVFIKQLQVAKELDLPVNVHSRSAAQVTIATMREHGGWTFRGVANTNMADSNQPCGVSSGVQRALLHNFAGKPSVALEGVKDGYVFSFPPAVCRNTQRDKLIRQIPLEHICLETDSPSLGLNKHERNEPSSITSVCKYIADIKGLTPQMVQVVTAHNAYRLFPRVKQQLQTVPQS